MAGAERRVGMSKRAGPSTSLHKRIRGRDEVSTPPIKRKTEPLAFDAPPLSSDDDDEDVPQRSNAASGLSDSDSSDDSDRRRIAKASIKPTSFGKSQNANSGSRSTRGEKRDSETGISRSSKSVQPKSSPDRKRRKVSGVIKLPENLPSSAEQDENVKPADESKDIFGSALRQKWERKKKATYGSQKPKKKKDDASFSAPGLRIPDRISPVKAKRSSLIVPQDTGDSPVKEKPKFRSQPDLDDDDDLGSSARLSSSDPLAGKSRSSHIKKKRLKKTKGTRETSVAPPPPKAVFKLPDALPEIDRSTPNDGEILDDDLADELSGDEAANSASLSSSKAEEPDMRQAVCPWCGEPVDEGMLKDFSRGQTMMAKMQRTFCRKHTRITAHANWKLRGYPTVQWDNLLDRFATHEPTLLEVIEGEPSYFRDLLAEKVESGQGRSLKKEGNLNPGYYGPRGFNLMCDYLVGKFGELLKRKAVEDKVIAGRGSASFIQTVLVSELGVQLIMEDMGVSIEEARDILEESKELGEMIHEDL